MGIPALGMIAGLLIAVFVTYRKPRAYRIDTGADSDSGEEISGPAEIDRRKVAIALVAVVACFAVQTFLTWTESKADPLLVGRSWASCCSWPPGSSPSPRPTTSSPEVCG